MKRKDCYNDEMLNPMFKEMVRHHTHEPIENIFMVDMRQTPCDYKVVFALSTNNERYYEVTYDENADDFYLNVYNRLDHIKVTDWLR